MEKFDGDDHRDLPGQYQNIYLNPYRVFGLDESTYTIALVRDAYRKACLAFCPHFSGLGNPKISFMQSTLAYHLIRGTMKGPSKKLAESLATHPCMDVSPGDIIPTLRPLKTNGLSVPKEYRGFRMLSITLLSYRYEFAVPMKPVFIFDVHYALRRHSIELKMEQLIEFHKLVMLDLLTLPDLPKIPFMAKAGLSNLTEQGEQLVQYLIRIHFSLANKGFFSPRLMNLLKINYEQVQSEEEGVIISILDTPTLPLRTVFHLIEESWLVKWRRFAMGRGPRRYLPPGKITNQKLLDKLKEEKRRTCKIAKDYRCVNYNVWRFYELVHSGGPIIPRIEEDIYSPFGISHLQGVILIQSHMRIFLAKKLRRELYNKKFSTSKNVKAILIKNVKEQQEKQIQEVLEFEGSKRTNKELIEAIVFTQAVWRKKKKYIPEELLAMRKKDQEVFARIRGGNMEEGTKEGVVVSDVHSILHIGSTRIYTRIITEDEGKIPFKLKRLPGTELAIITESESGSFSNDSRLLSINAYPTSSLSFNEIKKKLTMVSWPLVLELEKPYKAEMKPNMETIANMIDPNLQYQAFKIMLTCGFDVIKHNNGNNTEHITTIRLTDKELLYRSKNDPTKKEDDLWNKFALFTLKYVLNGEQSETIIKKKKKVNPNHCFELIFEDRGIAFEYADDNRMKILKSKEKQRKADKNSEDIKKRALQLQELQFYDKKNKDIGLAARSKYLNENPEMTEEQYHDHLCTLIYNNLRQLVLEIRGGQTFVDKDGIPIKRTKAKATLRKV